MTIDGLPWQIVVAFAFSGLLILAGLVARFASRRRGCDECGKSAPDLRRDGCWCEPSLNPTTKGR